MALAAEEEIGTSFINAQDTVPEQKTLMEMLHQQHPTRIQVDNNTTNEFDKKN